MSKKIFYNGDILTLEKEEERVEAVYIKDGIIQKCGSVIEVKEAAGEAAELISLDGKTMLPAFVDSHSHFASVGQSALSCDLSECKNFDDIVQKLKDYIIKNKIKDSEFVTGNGYDHNFLEEKEHPTRDILDRISTKHMIAISHRSGHMGTVNSRVLEKLGLNDESEYGQGGKYYRYSASGQLNGYMEENAFMDVMRLAKKPNLEEMKKLILQGQEIYLKNGITTVQNGGSTPQETDVLVSMAEEDLFTVDIIDYMMINHTAPEKMASYDKYIKGYYNKLKIGGYKMFLDGSPQAKTAWMSQPYKGEKEYRGYPIFEDEKVLEYVTRAVDEGQQLLTHCNGDAASEQLITAYEQAGGSDSKKEKLRPVMIHSQTVREDQLERMKSIGMIPSIFVAHVYYWGDIHMKNLGKDRGNNISPARTALNKGLVINFHQDSPVIKPNMIETIWCAVNRISKGGRVIGKNQAVSVYEALRAITYGGAYEYFEEQIKGTIKEGKTADLVILSENPMKVEKIEINRIKVLETYKAGEAVYKYDSSKG